MRYWLLKDRKPEGPFLPEALVKLTDFDPGLMICPEDRPTSDRANWRPARKFQEVLDALRAHSVLTAPVPPPQQAAAVGRGRKPLLIVLAVMAVIALAAVYFLRVFSFPGRP